jgi:hypothetical protein
VISKDHTVTATHRDFEITVFTCRRPDEIWTAEATIRHESEHASQSIPLLEGPSAEFPTESEARDYVLHAAAAWLDEHYPARPMPNSPGGGHWCSSSQPSGNPSCCHRASLGLPLRQFVDPPFTSWFRRCFPCQARNSCSRAGRAASCCRCRGLELIRDAGCSGSFRLFPENLAS